MRRALLGVVVVVGGCAFEPGELPDDMSGGGGAGSDTGGEDEGRDRDGDGIADIVDNCVAVANVEQRDHDDDGNGDACDPCPHRSDSGADADGDGVGDACDPNPTTAGDRVAFFEGFYGALTWDNTIGTNTWQLESGQIRQPDVDGQHQLVRDDDPDLRSVHVEMRVRVNALSAVTGSRRSLGIVTTHRNGDDYLFCGIAAPGPSAIVNVGRVDTDWLGNPRYLYNEAAFAQPMTGDWLTVQARTIALDQGRTRIECSTSRGNQPQPTDAVYDADTGINGDVGIRTNGADASFDYVFVVESPTQ